MVTDDERAKLVEKMMTPELQAIAKIIDDRIPDGWGFGLILFEFGHKTGEPLLWISNARREDMIETMREYVEKRGG